MVADPELLLPGESQFARLPGDLIIVIDSWISIGGDIYYGSNVEIGALGVVADCRVSTRGLGWSSQSRAVVPILAAAP